jgi:hypothetical protein
LIFVLFILFSSLMYVTSFAFSLIFSILVLFCLFASSPFLHFHFLLCFVFLYIASGCYIKWQQRNQHRLRWSHKPSAFFFRNKKVSWKGSIEQPTWSSNGPHWYLWGTEFNFNTVLSHYQILCLSE